MKAYHGTKATFTEFDSNLFGTSSNLEQYGSGFYFSTDEEIARSYGDVLYEVEIDMKNPYVVENDTNTNNILLSPKEVQKIVERHPNIYVPADDEEKSNPLGDYVPSFWDACKKDNPHFDKNLKLSIKEVVQMLMSRPTLLNLDMFYEYSGVPKQRFLEAVKTVTGRDGILVKGQNVDIVVAWFSEQIAITKMVFFEKEEKREYTR